MQNDAGFDRGLLAGSCFADRGAKLAVDCCIGKVEKQVDQTCGGFGTGQQAVEQGREFRPDAREGVDFGEKRVEEGWSHSRPT